MQLVMMRIPARDNNESVSQNYSKQGSSAGYKRLSLEETEIIMSLNT